MPCLKWIPTLALLVALLEPAADAQNTTEIINRHGDGTNGLSGELSIAVEKAVEGSSNVYVAGSGSDNVFKVTPGGPIVEIIDKSGDGTDPLSGPADVAVDAAGNVYVIGSVSDNAFKITPDGAVTEIIDGRSGLLTPRSLTVDTAGNVYVAGYDSHNVFRIGPGGAISQIAELSGDGYHPLIAPLGIAADASGNVYVTGSASHNAFRIGPGGAISQIIGMEGDGANRLESPWGIAADAAGNVYVAGSSSHNAFKISPDGAINEIIDVTGDGVDALVGAVGIAAEASGHVYVTGGGSSNTFSITPGGKVRKIADHTSYSIAAEDSGIVYVAGDPFVSSTAYRIAPAGIALADVAGLVVPGFEVEVGDPAGPTTFFSVRNTTDLECPVKIDFYGPAATTQLRSDSFSLGGQKTLTRNIRDDLSGLEVENGLARGLAVITGGFGAAALDLEGDYFRLDPGNDFATGGRLVRPSDFCLDREIRYVNFGSGSELRILVNRPRGTATPSFSYTAYNEGGEEVAGGDFSTSNVLSVLDVEDLVPGGNFGTLVLDFSNAGGGWVSAKYSAFGRFSVELSSACLDQVSRP